MPFLSSLYIVVTNRPEMDARLEETIKATFPSAFYTLGRGQWLVSAEGTAREVSDKLGVSGTEPATIHSTIVFAVSGYFGRASSETWEWIATKLGGHIRA